MQETKKIWMDGKFCDWKDANVHILTHTLHYGLGVFEGIRCYETEKGTAVFRLKEHVKRLFESAHIMQMKVPFEQEEIFHAIIDTIRANGLKSGYIRPLIYLGYGQMGLNPKNSPVRVSIAVWPWGKYLGEGQDGIRTIISSYTRLHSNIFMTKAKVCGGYVNSILAKCEALNNGYDEAILLDPEGFVAEGTGENIFIIKNGKLKTPPTDNSLCGITRDTILKITEGKYEIEEKRFSRDDLYIADEVFLTGTAAEITAVKEVDQRKIGIGKTGPITKNIEEMFYNIVNGRDKKYAKWLSYVK